ncbi:sensor domain-containing protein [Streptomyces sp. L7]
MRATLRQAGRATLQLVVSAAMAFGSYIFITVLLITAILTVSVVGAFMLPETACCWIRRIAGAKRQQAGAWTGRKIPEAYQPLNGTVRERVRHGGP